VALFRRGECRCLDRANPPDSWPGTAANRTRGRRSREGVGGSWRRCATREDAPRGRLAAGLLRAPAARYGSPLLNRSWGGFCLCATWPVRRDLIAWATRGFCKVGLVPWKGWRRRWAALTWPGMCRLRVPRRMQGGR
jgi:hypothetical protein